MEPVGPHLSFVVNDVLQIAQGHDDNGMEKCSKQ